MTMDLASQLNQALETAKFLHERGRKLNKELDALLVGKEAVILCERYNGQQFGSSKPKLKGKRVIIWAAYAHDDKLLAMVKSKAGNVYDSAIEIKDLKVITELCQAKSMHN